MLFSPQSNKTAFLRPVFGFSVCALSMAVHVNALADTASSPIEEVIVTADFRDAKLNDLAGSISVIDAQAIASKEARHLESILSLTPNVNFSSGASRGRFFQIRGIGERSQFVEPVNPSVGLLIDGIDMSGAGAAATMLDVQQVEVLRGPQGTIYGANALAGLINIKSNDVSDTFEAKLAVDYAGDNTRTVQGVASGPISDGLSYRVASQSHKGDGYMKNAHLNRDDTAKFDETTFRGKLKIEASEALTITLTGLYVDVDNGYDAFTLDNSYTTLSDEPGHDRQETKALAANIEWQLTQAVMMESTISASDSETEYGYDEDWTFSGIHPDGYSSKDNYIRERDNQTVDVRFLSNDGAKLFSDSTDWLLGLYYFDQDVDLKRQYTYLPADFSSEFSTQRQAVYGQLISQLNEEISVTTGLRFENQRNDYQDSQNVNGDVNEDLWGGRIAINYELNPNQSVYALLSRGYKSGGFNTDGTLPSNFRSFDTETLLNYEAGLKGMWPDAGVSAQIAVFYQDRDDVQIKSSNAVARADGSTEFVDFIDNSASGESYGLELSSQWQLSSVISAFANVGLLQTELNDSDLKRNGGDAAQAPEYQVALGLDAQFDSGWYGSADVEGKDEFYFSDSHNAQSEAVVLLNAKVGYRIDAWDFSVWGKNLSDEETRVRGFSGFGNDPRNGYESGEYFQLGAPRQIGVSGSYSF